MAEPTTDSRSGVPKVSVVMPVYNGMPYLPEAIDSILGQTFDDFEFVIVDDCSTDDTPRVLAEYARKDPRIRVLTNPANAGVAQTLATGVAAAAGEYVARIDADDRYAPAMLEQMVLWLDARPHVGVVATFTQIMDANGSVVAVRRAPTSADEIRRALQKENPLGYSVLMRRTLALQVGNYRPAFLMAEDYDLWLRLSEVCDIEVLPEPLLFRRQWPGSVTVKEKRRVLAAFTRLCVLFGKQRRETGSDRYEEYVQRGLFPRLRGGSRSTLDVYHLKLAKWAVDGGAYTEAMRQTWHAFRASAKCVPQCMALCLRVAVKKILVSTGLFRLAKKVVYGKSK